MLCSPFRGGSRGVTLGPQATKGTGEKWGHTEMMGSQKPGEGLGCRMSYEGAHEAISGAPPGPLTRYRPRCSRDRREWAEISVWKARRRLSAHPPRVEKGLPAPRKFWRSWGTVGSPTHPQGCAGKTGRCMQGGVTTDSSMGCPTGKGGTCTALGSQHRLQNPAGPKFKSRLRYRQRCP